MPNPRTAAEWVFIICTNYRLHVPDDADGCMFCTEFEGALIAFARQQVEIERSRWISDQCTANQAGQAMGRIEGYTEGWNAALEQAVQKAFRYECNCPQTMLCGHRVAAGEIAAAIRVLEP